MSLATNLQDLATRVATEIKSVRTLLNGNQANLNGLTTTAKTNLVAAINELKAGLDAAAGGAAGINDAATGSGSTWSSSKIASEISAAAAAVVNGSPGALDTLEELANALGDDANFASTVTTALGRRVSVDTQTFTSGEKGQARTNIGAAADNHTHDAATGAAAGFLSASDKNKLDGIATGANNYTHPSGDGNRHVPATAAGDVNEFLKSAGSAGGAPAWSPVTKADVGLGNVDNTSDANKPISTAQQTALNLKANTADVGDTGTNFVATFEAGLV
jgi:hypothetical protein